MGRELRRKQAKKEGKSLAREEVRRLDKFNSSKYKFYWYNPNNNIKSYW